MRRRDFVSTIGAVLTVPQVCAAAPECSPSAGGLTARDHRAYLAAFNRHDFEGFGRYYAEDVIFEGRGDFAAGPLRKGQTVRSRNFIWYAVADGHFTHIRSAHYRYL